MTETQETPAAAVVVDSGSFLGNLFNLYFEPSATFAKIFTKPRIVAIVLFQIALGVLFSTIWFQKLDAKEFMRQQMELNPRIQQMPTEQVEKIIETQASFMKTWGRIGPLIAPLVLDGLLAGLLMFMFRFFMAAEVSFLASLATVAWTFATVGLVQTPIMLAVMALKGDWNLSPDQVVQANPTVFFEASALPRWLWSLLGSFDLFSLWTLFLLAAGLSVASKRGLSTGLWGVGICWVVYVSVKTGFLLIFS
ncbi:MAG: hypothetical protein ABI672_00805 [Vicinamibacteria bacterium]